MFGLSVAFTIDQDELQKRFLTLQKQHHPDNTHDLKAEQNTALINHAFKTLHHDDARAVYLLELANIGFNSDKSISDEAFLMQMMTYRMDLEDAHDEHDHAQIKAIGDKVRHLSQETALVFDEVYQAQDWQNAQIQAQKLKFLANLYHDCVTYLNQATPDNDDDLYV